MDSIPIASEWISHGDAWGVALTAEQGARLVELAAWLAERAFPLGLTNYRTPADLAAHALLPTFAFFRLADASLPATLLDLGAGSGALGLTLAIICPEMPVILADRRRRSATFMNLTRARLRLDNVEVRQVSAEELENSVGSSLATVCFRALAPGETALSLARPLLSPSGWVAAWHQPGDAAFTSPPQGWICRETVSTSLPGLVVSRIEIVSRETISAGDP